MIRFHHLLITAALCASPTISLAEEAKKFYVTGSIGYSQISGMDYQLPGGRFVMVPDGNVGTELGVGYDFGSLRMEATWDRAFADGGSTGSAEWNDDVVMNGYLGSLYLDFENESKWTPFIGGSIGILSANIGDDYTTSSPIYYGIQGGISYATSDSIDIYAKASYLKADSVDFGVDATDWNFGSYAARFGARFKF